MELVSGRTLDQVIAKGRAACRCLAIRDPDHRRPGRCARRRHRPPRSQARQHHGDRPGQIKILDFGLATLVKHHGLAAPTRQGASGRRDRSGHHPGTMATCRPNRRKARRWTRDPTSFLRGDPVRDVLGPARLSRRLDGGHARGRHQSRAASSRRVSAACRPPVERLVSRCLRKDLSRRAQHADDIKVALEELREDSSSGVLAGGSVLLAGRTAGLCPSSPLSWR